jgi:hypothetical protein
MKLTYFKDGANETTIYYTSVPKMTHWHYDVEEITVNVRKMLKKFYWTYLLI